MLKCRYCGTANPAGTTYCNHCGGDLTSTSASSAGGAGGAGGAAGAGARAAAVGRAAAAPNASAHAASATATPPAHAHMPTGALPSQTRLNRRYLVLAPVGQGGMAAVYRGIDTRGNRQVAIKEMSQDGLSPTEEAEALAAFRTEAEMLKRLNHRNLPKVIDIFSEGARHYLVMEYVDGETLEQKQQAAGGGPLPEPDVLHWAEQLCSVLGYLHALRPPIIFRDLKPANIMVTPEGQIKLIDFGIARVFTPGRLKDTQILGTPGFAPPEQYGRTQTDARADIYALGVTLYQLLTGYDPATSPFSLPPANTRNPRLSPQTQAAIEHATRLDREARYATVAEFERDLLHPDGFVFRNGQRARTVAELIALCRANPLEAQDHLYTGRFETWLKMTGNAQAARAASVVVKVGGDHATGLEAFMTQALRPQQAPGAQSRQGKQAGQAAGQRAGQRAQPASPAAKAPSQAPWGAGANTTAGRIARGIATSAAMQRAAAQAAAMVASYVGTQILVEVRPQKVDFGVVMAGMKSNLTLVIGGQFGLPVTGRVVSHAPWLRVDPASFVGTSSVVKLTADTIRLTQAGMHQTTLEVTSGTQHVSVPVSIEVVGTRPTRAAGSAGQGGAAAGALGGLGRFLRRAASPPKAPPPPKPKPAQSSAGASSSAGSAASKSASAARRPAGRKHAMSVARAPWTRLLTAWVLVCGLGGWAALQLLNLAAAQVVALPGWLPLGSAMLLVMLLLAPVAAVTGHWGPDMLKRAGTALLCAAGGLGLVLLLTRGWHVNPFVVVPLPHWQACAPAGSLGCVFGLPAVPGELRAVLLLGLLGVSVGATLGVTPLLSRLVRQVLAFAARQRRVLTILAAVALGGWAGSALLGWIGSGLPAGIDNFLAVCGAIIGCVGALVLAVRATQLARRGHRTALHP